MSNKVAFLFRKEHHNIRSWRCLCYFQFMVDTLFEKVYPQLILSNSTTAHIHIDFQRHPGLYGLVSLTLQSLKIPIRICVILRIPVIKRYAKSPLLSKGQNPDNSQFHNHVGYRQNVFHLSSIQHCHECDQRTTLHL